MLVELHWDDGDNGFWLNWNLLQSRWIKSEQYLLPKTLVSSYHNLWFDFDQSPARFKIGELSFFNDETGFCFSNGRNRTTLLSTLLKEVPLALIDASENIPYIKAAIIRPIKANEKLEIPDLPILTCHQLRELGGEDFGK